MQRFLPGADEDHAVQLAKFSPRLNFLSCSQSLGQAKTKQTADVIRNRVLHRATTFTSPCITLSSCDSDDVFHDEVSSIALLPTKLVCPLLYFYFRYHEDILLQIHIDREL